ncbi:uncharacterized protein LOC117103363 [Anneissia japonica]|uniref:uncharacterized protein LOC117103363 n=1 Tax=Anneissia japonica TaxID=1529436 RepID=UPI0014259ADD|nr:uncharacterized protein LOC117103363 [Anneissia japonica]
MMANKEAEHGRVSSHPTFLFAIAFAAIILVGCLSLYTLHRVNRLEATNEKVLIALESSLKNKSEDHNQEFLRHKRSNHQRTASPGLASAHLVGHLENRLFRGQWLTWCFSNCLKSFPQNATNCRRSTLSHSDFCVSSDQNTIRIVKAGYYYVYAQLVMTSELNAMKSLQVAVKRPGGLMGDAYPVLSSYKTQYPLGFTADTPISSKDSVYMGGVMFFCPDDLVGVRANPENTEDITLDSSNDNSAYFGAVTVNEIPKHVVYRYCARNV